MASAPIAIASDHAAWELKSALAEWLRGPLRAWADERLTVERLQATGWLDPAPIRSVWQEHLSRRANHDYRLWTVLVLVEFLSRWDTR